MKLLYNESIITNRNLSSRLVAVLKTRFFSVYTEGSSFSTKSALTLCWLVLSMGLSVTAFAQKYVKVTAMGSGNGSSWDNALGASSLKATIEAGGIVYVAAGTYNPTATMTLNAATNQIIGGFAATATGTSLSSYNPAINQTVISASAMSAGLKRVFYSTSLSVELKGLVLQDGSQGTTGGAVYVGSGKVLTFTDLVIKNNTAGGIGVYSVTGATASVAFTNCIFTNNTNTGNGGALVCSTVYENPDPFAIAPTAGKFTMTNCSFDGNTSANQGGAIEFTTSHAWEISGTCFSNNSAFLAGGVIFTTSKKNILTGCNFTNNTATTAEGGAMIATTASATLNNCNFVSNTATGVGTGYGGAIFATTASLTMSNTAFYNNTSKAGGAIYSTTWTNNLTSTATNCIFSGNAATNVAGTTTGTNGGGAMVINANANAWGFNGCTFTDNTVPTNGWGGAVSHYDAETTFNNTTFYNNTKGGVANISGSDIKNYDNAGHFNTITNCTMQLTNAAAYTNQAGGTDATSYGFGAGNTFNNTTNPNVAAAPSITCPVSVCSAGLVAPSVSSTTLSNVCPMATVNLNSLVTSTPPSGARLRWHTVATNPTAADSVATPSVLATAGTYYAYYFDAANNCYSPASAAVTVTMNPACTDTDGDGILDTVDIDDDNDGVPDINEKVTTTLTYTGADQIVTAPANAIGMVVKVWGAGGGHEIVGTGPAGVGGFTTATFGTNVVIPGTQFSVVVGGGGVRAGIRPEENFQAAVYGFGSVAAHDQGGGLSGIFTGTAAVGETQQSRALIIAGGGGGYENSGGASAGSEGYNGNSPTSGGQTGTMRGVVDYLAGVGCAVSNTSAHFSGGGGGYEGGTRAATLNANYSALFGTCGNTVAAARGGSGFVSPLATNSQKLFTPDLTTNFPPMNTDPFYTSGIGKAGTLAAQAGGDGLVVICWIIDTDGDAIANHLDLDSDNDGCSDAYEAGATTDKTTNYKFTSAFGTNGLADSKETVADNGIINYTSTYNTYALSNRLNICTDTDNDGVSDILDLDDDNDGILDTVEDCKPAVDLALFNGLSASAGVPATQTVAVNANINVKLTLSADNGTTKAFATGGTFNTRNPSGDESGIVFDCTGITSTAQSNKAIFEFSKPINHASFVYTDTDGGNGVSKETTTFIGSLNGQIITLTPTDVETIIGPLPTQTGNVFDGGLSNPSVVYRITFSQPIDRLEVIASINANSLNTATIQRMFDINFDCDTDNDGIADALDLDSDNDGCSDAFEAGATTDKTANYQFTGAFGTNGLANSLETVVDNGIVNYTLTYSKAIDNTVNACCPTTAPSVSGTTLSNACPATTVDLNSLHTGTTPSGARLRWHTVTTNPTATDSVATPSVLATAGTYYAYYFDAANNCYSPATAAVTVTITACCATLSVGGTTAYSGGTVCSTANVGTITLTGQTGNVVKWQTSTNGGTTWTDIASTLNKTTYNFINAANNQQFRAVVNANIVTCTDEFSSVVTITTSATACTTTTCSYTSSSFSPTISTSSNPTYTTHVILVNPTTGVIDYVTAANSTAFTGVAVGGYIMYAVTYDNTITPIPTLTVGTNISTLTGCFTVSDPLITKVCCPTVVPTTTVSQPTCSVTTGTITVNTPSTGVTYSFDNGTTYQASNIKSGLAAATTYQVVVKDDVSGCSSTATPSVVNPEPILSAPTASVSTQPTCLTATASVYLSGLPSTGTWTLTRLNTTTLATFVVTSTGAGSAFSYGNVPSGTYTYTVKNNATSCESTASNSITVNAQPASPTITNVAKGDPSVLSCPALNNGEVTVTATGSNLEYSKDNGATWQASNTFTGLVAGSYNIKVSDNVSGCDVAYPSNPVVLVAPICNQNPTITSPLTATTPENVSPTTPVYTATSTDPNVGQTKTFSFETGSVDNAQFNIDPITGVVTFIASPDFDLPTDDNGDNIYEIIVKVCDNGTPQYCATQAVQITVTDIDECVGFAAPIVAVNQPNCTTATATITITSPTTGVTYSFDNGVSFQASNVLSNVAAGVYQIVIKNSIGCKTVPKDYTVYPAPTVGCSCNNATGTLVSTVSNQNTGVDYTQKYVLTDNAGVIAQMANTPSFTGLTSTTYAIYAVNYKTTEGVNGLTIGQNIAGANSPCLDVSKPLFYTVCLPVFVCNNVSGNITAVVSGQNIGTTFTQSYALTDENEVIIRLSTTPSFTGLVNGRYKFYGVNYETAIGITGLTLGQNISGLAGACLNVSEPLLFQVCQVPEICNNRIDDDGDGLIDCEDSVDCPSCGCDNTTGDITFTNTGQATTEYTQVYVLTDSTGKILKTNTAATFTGLSTGRYRVYAINYKTADGITGITVGGNISGVTGLCFDKSLPLLFKVCLCVTMNVKVMLEGPYQTATSDMQTMLNQRGLLPGQTPVGQFALPTPQGQPYKGAPWNYLGTEGDTITTYPATVVDWVLLTLRTDATSTNNVFRVTGLLHSDGHISFLSPCFDIVNDSYYVVIEHRNHVGVMSPNRVPITNGVLTHDFTVNDSYVLINPPSFGQKQKGSKWMMYAGDGRKILTTDNYDVNASDSQYWKGQSGTFDQYKGGDYNMDADVNFADSYLWKFNSGKYSGVPH